MSVESAMSFWESRVASRSTKAARIEAYVPLPSASRLGQDCSPRNQSSPEPS